MDSATKIWIQNYKTTIDNKQNERLDGLEEQIDRMLGEIHANEKTGIDNSAAINRLRADIETERNIRKTEMKKLTNRLDVLESCNRALLAHVNRPWYKRFLGIK